MELWKYVWPARSSAQVTQSQDLEEEEEDWDKQLAGTKLETYDPEEVSKGRLVLRQPRGTKSER